MIEISTTAVFYTISYFLMLISSYFFFLYFYLPEEKKEKEFKEFPNVLIIIPAYNEEKTIGNTIENLLNLDYPKENLRIVVVDDGSKDKTYELAKEYESEIVKVMKKENGGKASAINYALKNVRWDYDYFVIIDADTEVPKNFLKDMIKEFDEKTLATVPVILPKNRKNLLEKIQYIEYLVSNFSKEIYSKVFSMYLTPTASVIKREALDIVGYFDERSITEDLNYALRIIEKGYRVKLVPKMKVLTVVPSTLKKLYKQRLRWNYGFIETTRKYGKAILKLGIPYYLFIMLFWYSVFALGWILFLFSKRIFEDLSFYLKASAPLGYFLSKYQDILSMEYFIGTISSKIFWLMLIVTSISMFTVYYSGKIRKEKPNPLLAYVYLAYFWVILAVSQVNSIILHIMKRGGKWWR